MLTAVPFCSALAMPKEKRRKRVRRDTPFQRDDGKFVQ